MPEPFQIAQQQAVINQKIAEGKAALASGERRVAANKFNDADNQARMVVSVLRNSVNEKQAGLALAPFSARPGLAALARKEAAIVNDLVEKRRKLRQVCHVLGPGHSVPPGAGLFARIPMTMRAASGNVAAGSAYISCQTGGAGSVVAITPSLPWLEYRVHGIVIGGGPTGAQTGDQITIEDLKINGGPNLQVGEGPLPVRFFAEDSAMMYGLRYKGTIRSPNTVQATIAYNALTVDYALNIDLLVEIVSDEVYGDINRFTQARQLAAAKVTSGGIGSPMVAGQGGWMEMLPLLDNAGNSIVSLAFGGTTSAALTSESLAYQYAEVIGLEVYAQEAAQSITMLSDFKVNGGSSAFPQDTGEAVWRSYSGSLLYNNFTIFRRPAIRYYPELSTNNSVSMTVTLRDKDDSTAGGAAGSAADVSAAVIINRSFDEVFGKPNAPVAAVMALLP